MATPQGPRPYDENDPKHKAWMSQVYQTATSFVPIYLASSPSGALFKEICLAFQAKHADLADDSIRDPRSWATPKWKHIVATALQHLKKTGKVSLVAHRWRLGSTPVKPPPPAPTGAQVQPQPAAATPAQPQEAPPTVPIHTHDIDEILEQHKRKLRTGLHGRLNNMGPEQFEHLVARFLESHGLTNVVVTGRVGDRGMDGNAELAFLGVKVVFQAKRYALGNNVAGDAVRDLAGTVRINKYDRGILITTSDFTPGAREDAGRADGVVQLVNGEALVKAMLAKDLGVKTVPMVETKIDEGFFRGLERS